MSEGYALIIGAFIGGGLSFLTTYYIQRRGHMLKAKEYALPRILDALEFLEYLIIKIRNDERLSEKDIYRFFVSSCWMPEPLKTSGINITSSLKTDTVDHVVVSEFHEKLLDYKAMFILVIS